MNQIPISMNDLQQLIAQGEGQQLEFKRSLAELETAARSVVAFANADGGIVLLGVRDSGEIVGVEVGEHTKERISTAITDSTDPIVYPSTQIIPMAGKAVVAIKVEASENHPHLCKGRAFFILKSGVPALPVCAARCATMVWPSRNWRIWVIFLP